MRELRNILSDFDSELELVPLIELADEPIYGVSTDGARAATLWDVFHDQVDVTDHWPIIVGTDRDVEGHRQAAGLRTTHLERLDAGAAAILERLNSMPLEDALDQSRSVPPQDASRRIDVATPADWHDELPDAGELALEAPLDLATGSAHDEVYLALCHTPSSWRCPLLLNFGGWNDCPPAEAHAAQLAQWQKTWGAELISLTDTTMELRVARRPDSWKQAFDVASEQADYCPELVSRGSWNLRTLAEYLCEKKLWRFWWS